MYAIHFGVAFKFCARPVSGNSRPISIPDWNVWLRSCVRNSAASSWRRTGSIRCRANPSSRLVHERAERAATRATIRPSSSVPSRNCSKRSRRGCCTPSSPICWPRFTTDSFENTTYRTMDRASVPEESRAKDQRYFEVDFIDFVS